MSDNSEKVSPTLRQIANEAGVALSTVSEALRGRPGASKATAKHVRETAERMGWRPNPLVSAWLSHVRTGQKPPKHDTLAFLINYRRGAKTLFEDPERYIFRAYWNGARERAGERGYALEVFNYHELGVSRLARILQNRRIEGIVVAPQGRTRQNINLDWERFAAVALGYSVAGLDLHRAANHHFHTVKLCVEKLRALGYRRIGLAITRVSNERTSGMFLGAYLGAVHERGLRRLRPFLPDEADVPRDRFLRWVDREKPEVVMALQVQGRDWLREAGFRFPDDIGYAHLDLPPEDESLDMGDAGMYQHPESIGATAVDLVTAQIERNERGVPRVPKVSLVESRWVDGPSVREGV